MDRDPRSCHLGSVLIRWSSRTDGLALLDWSKTSWTTQPGRETQESASFFFFLQDFPDLDLMLKKRRVRTHSCCAAVAPLCCRKGQRKVNKCARSTQISFTFWLSARPFYNLFFLIVKLIWTIVITVFCLGYFFGASTIASVYIRLLPWPQLSGRMQNIKVNFHDDLKTHRVTLGFFLSRCYTCVIFGSILLWNRPPPITRADAGLQDLCSHWPVSRSFLLFFCIHGERSSLGEQRSFFITMTRSQQIYFNTFHLFKILQKMWWVYGLI